MQMRMFSPFEYGCAQCVEDLSFFLDDSNDQSVVVSCINPHSVVTSRRDPIFFEALTASDYLIPDGVGIVMAWRLLYKKRLLRITGPELTDAMLDYANREKKSVFFLGSSNAVLDKLTKNITKAYPGIPEINSYSPPYKDEFSAEDNELMIRKINAFSPDILFVGMTAPKQEKWILKNRAAIDTSISLGVGAAFDFLAGTAKRAPSWMQQLGLEWVHRSMTDPGRLGRRNVMSNPQFIWLCIVSLMCKRDIT